VAPSPGGSDVSQPQPKTIPEVIVDLKDMTVTYARQETVEPLKGLVNFFKFGFAGSVLVALGTIELTLFILRVLETETGTALTGNWSWVPYAVALLFDALVTGLFILFIKSKEKEEVRR
jgi:hypothetical protein